jgi:hypothetical protein
MHLSNLFPAQKGTIITLFNVGLDASSLMFLILHEVWLNFDVHYKWLFLAFSVLPLLSLVSGFFLWPMKAYEEETNEDDPLTINSVVQIEHPNFFQTIKTREFWLCAIFTGANLLRVNFYIGTVQEQLKNIHGVDLEQAQYYTDLFAILLPMVGVGSVPLVGWSLDRFGLLFSIFALTISGNVYAVTSLLFMFPLQVQIATFIVVAIFRALLFSVMATYVAVKWGFENFGKLWGIIFLFGGIINIGINFIVDAIGNYLDDNYFWPNVGMSFLSLLLAAYPFYLLKNPPPDLTPGMAV